MLLRIALVTVIILAAAAGLPARPLAAGERLAVEDLKGERHLIPDEKRKATLLVFAGHDCPISNSYAPEVNRIATEYGRRGVAVYVVYAQHDLPAAEASKHAADYGYPCPALLDPAHALVKAAGVTITPEVAVLAPDGKVLYRGRIDDRYVDFGKARPQPTRRDLRLALDAVLAGKPVPVPKTRSIGCFIPAPR